MYYQWKLYIKPYVAMVTVSEFGKFGQHRYSIITIKSIRGISNGMNCKMKPNEETNLYSGKINKT